MPGGIAYPPKQPHSCQAARPALLSRMAYDLFLFDLDDTLLDFRASERLCFAGTMQAMGMHAAADALYADYHRINSELWSAMEQGRIDRDRLRVERWRLLFDAHNLALDPERASTHYLEALPNTVVLVDHAEELCAALSARGEIGIITNGFHQVQSRRLANSALAPYISFMGVSDACGFAKPDPRFFAHTVGMARRFDKARTLIVGDRLEADIAGGHAFGIHTCWFNPHRHPHSGEALPHYEIAHLSELHAHIG